MGIRILPHLDADVVVAGAGPAGASAATHLAQSGLRVLLFDMRRFPRDKTCGDFVGPQAIRELEQLGIDKRLEYLDSNVIRRATVYLDGDKLLTRKIPQIGNLPDHGRVVPRYELDGWIVDAACRAGAKLVQETRVENYQIGDRCVEVQIRSGSERRLIRARVLVGADGSNSIIAKKLRGGPAPRSDRILAVRTYFENVTQREDCAELLFAKQSFPGYCWLFPTGESTTNVGIGMALDTLPDQHENLGATLKRLISSDPILRRRLRGATTSGRIAGWPLTTYNPHLPISAQRVLLVGDAAGLINPLNGEGIQYALMSGRWASETVTRQLERDQASSSALASYSRAVEKNIRQDMALANLLVQLIRNRALNPAWLTTLRIITDRAHSDPSYATITGGILAGLVPSRQAISATILTGTLHEAALQLGSGVMRPPAESLSFVGGITLNGIQIASDLLRQSVDYPSETVRWLTGLLDASIELGTETLGSIVRSSPQSSRSIM